jgi:hypothetical protein
MVVKNKVLIGYLGHKNKFETDQRNIEAELAWKRAAEEEDKHRDAAKQRKAVAESPVELVAALKVQCYG